MILCQADRTSVSSPPAQRGRDALVLFLFLRKGRMKNLTMSNRPGPHTEAGRAASSRTATSYGLTSLHLVVTGQDRPETIRYFSTTPAPHRISSLRNELPAPAPKPTRHFSTPHTQRNQCLAKRNPRNPPAHLRHFSAPGHPTRATPCKTKSARTPRPTRHFSTPPHPRGDRGQMG